MDLKMQDSRHPLLSTRASFWQSHHFCPGWKWRKASGAGFHGKNCGFQGFKDPLFPFGVLSNVQMLFPALLTTLFHV